VGKINGKKYFIYDSTWVIDEDGDKAISNYFNILTEAGAYQIAASPGNGYYPVKTEEFNLEKAISYTFTFYFIRKDELKRN